MKTRIIKTEVHRKLVLLNAPKDARHLFLTIITSEYINLTGIFTYPDQYLLTDTGMSNDELAASKQWLETKKKLFFHEGWIFVVNAHEHNGYKKSPKTAVAYKREIALVPSNIKAHFAKLIDTTMNTTIDTTIYSTPNPKTLNPKTENKNIVLSDEVTSNLHKIKGIVKPSYNTVANAILALVLITLPFLTPVNTYAKTVRVKLTLKAGLAKNSSPRTVKRQPRPILAQKTATPAIYSLDTNKNTPDAQSAIFDQIRRYAWPWSTALAVARSESGLRSDAQGWNCYYTRETGEIAENGAWSTHNSRACLPEHRIYAWSVDCGVFQLNFPGKECPAESFNPEWNIQKAYEWKYAPRQSFGAWVAYTNGNYKAFIN